MNKVYAGVLVWVIVFNVHHKWLSYDAECNNELNNIAHFIAFPLLPMILSLMNPAIIILRGSDRKLLMPFSRRKTQGRLSTMTYG